jgi:hypothetical protein
LPSPFDTGRREIRAFFNQKQAKRGFSTKIIFLATANSESRARVKPLLRGFDAAHLKKLCVLCASVREKPEQHPKKTLVSLVPLCVEKCMKKCKAFCGRISIHSLAPFCYSILVL